LNHLKGGHYQLEIRGREPEKEWSDIKAIPILVKTAWWQSIWFKAGSGALLISLLLGFMAVRGRYRRRELAMRIQFEKELAEVQMEALRAQMNPHFLFNTMNSINHFILKNDADAASGYLTKFSRLIRQILQNSKSQTITLKDELDALRLYIEIEQLRFDGEFSFLIDVGANIHQESLSIPPMLIQPYVENAIWHGLMHKDDDRQLNITVSIEDQYLVIAVRDNGIGREAAKEFADHSGNKKSFGMRITSDRIDLVNKLYRTDTDVEVMDVLDQDGRVAGTEVVLTVPLIHKKSK
jgi:LytS/YehU family sensor histidine kinase